MNFTPIVGHAKTKARFLSALDSERFHHGWMLEGLSGIGKASLAKIFGMYLLGARGTETDPLALSDTDPIVQKCLSGSHPDFRIVERELNDKGKLKQDISVDQIRDLIHFFELKPAMGGWRVGIIDSLDEMNRSAENALLKTLEEPSSNCALFLIHHGRDPVLPTIRSRCRLERIQRLSEAETQIALENIGFIPNSSDLVRGRPGYTMAVAESTGMKSAELTRQFLKALPRANDNMAFGVVQAAALDDVAFMAFENEVLDWLSSTAKSHPGCASDWLKLSQLLAGQRKDKMDLTQTASKIVAALSTTSR